MDSGGMLSTMWTMHVEDDEGIVHLIHGDHRPMNNIYDSIPLGSRVVVCTHPNIHGEMVVPEDEFDSKNREKPEKTSKNHDPAQKTLEQFT